MKKGAGIGVPAPFLPSPEGLMHRGQVGVVRSTWFAPSMAYEVEFDAENGSQQVRCLLDDAQVECDFDGAMAANPV